MKQFKAEWQYNRTETTEIVAIGTTIDHLITQHNALWDYLKERDNRIAPPNYALEDEPRETITVPKPQWWTVDGNDNANKAKGYKQALSDASKASGITFKIEE